jgi:hypothetical protein
MVLGFTSQAIPASSFHDSEVAFIGEACEPQTPHDVKDSRFVRLVVNHSRSNLRRCAAGFRKPVDTAGRNPEAFKYFSFPTNIEQNFDPTSTTTKPSKTSRSTDSKTYTSVLSTNTPPRHKADPHTYNSTTPQPSS